MSRVPNVLGGLPIAQEVTRRVMHELDRADGAGATLDELLIETLYREQQRLAEPDCGPNEARDRAFIKTLRHAFARSTANDRRALLMRVVSHYVEEVTGHFDRRVYGFATSVVPAALGALLHGGKPSSHLFDVEERVLLEGEVDALQHAARTGTVVLVPTHVSNLDSLVLGYAIYRLGLPPFAYGAGLNLYSNPVLGFFMRHLGAFTVDRKKLDPVYLATVKEYATVLLERGQHMLFFPGGTRSRSGAIESHLKLGFLSRVITAFVNRRILDRSSAPIYVVPCTLSYPLVLEAQSLIGEYLSKRGGPHFVDIRDELEQPARWIEFLRGLGSLDVQVHVRFGSPLDPLGNAVDEQGCSRDARGHKLAASRYVQVDGVVRQDDARDAEYTRLLSEQVIAAYKRNAVALPSSVLAFALFNCLRRRYPQLDLFRLLRVLGPSTKVPLAELERELDPLLQALQRIAAKGNVRLGPELAARGKAAVLELGMATLRAYHRPAMLCQHADAIEVTQPELLLYYRNHLEGYDLPGAFELLQGREHVHTWGPA